MNHRFKCKETNRNEWDEKSIYFNIPFVYSNELLIPEAWAIISWSTMAIANLFSMFLEILLDQLISKHKFDKPSGP